MSRHSKVDPLLTSPSRIPQLLHFSHMYKAIVSQPEVVGAGATSILADSILGSWIASLHAGKWVTYSSSRMSFWQLMHFNDFISVLTLRFWNRRPLPMNLQPSFVSLNQTPGRSISTKPHCFAIIALQNPKPTMNIRCPSVKFWTPSIIRFHQSTFCNSRKQNGLCLRWKRPVPRYHYVNEQWVY